MIPKIIHYCWLSEDPFPELIDNCIKTWKKNLPDYEFMLWDTKRFPLSKKQWVKDAFESKKYAFAADYIRLYAVYNYGGIYLDTDIEVIKSFNDLLERPYFVGAEGLGIIEAGVFGAEKESDWIKSCLDYYKGKSFIKEDGSFNTLTLPRIMMSQISKVRTIKEVLPEEVNPETQSSDNENIYMFPEDFFCAKNHGTGKIEQTDNTYCIHHFAMSWLPKKTTRLPNLKRKLMGYFGVNFINNVIVLLGLRKIKRFLQERK